MMKVEGIIGETKYKAGVFSSEQEAMKKKYYEILKLERFSDLEEAKKEFFFRYGNVIPQKEFELNKLFPVREKPLYAVFYTPYCCGMTEMYQCEDRVKKLLHRYRSQIKWNYNVEYGVAVDRVLAMLAMKRRIKKAEITENIRPNVCYLYDE